MDTFFASNDVDDDSDDENESATEEEKYFEQFFVETTKRDEKGFVVRMPFKNKTEPTKKMNNKSADETAFYTSADVAAVYNAFNEKDFQKVHEICHKALKDKLNGLW